MDNIVEFCDENNLVLVEDSAQGIGALYKEKHCGGFGIAGCLSFYPAKVLGGLGDGGCILTNNFDLAEYAFSVRDHGRGKDLKPVRWGRNSRLDSLQARVLLERLKNLDFLIDKRRKIADIYNQKLKHLELKGFLKLPKGFSPCKKHQSTFQNYEIQATKRDQLKDFLSSKGVGTIKQWGGFSISHLNNLGYDINRVPTTKDLFQKLLLLPMNHLLEEEEAIYIGNAINNFYECKN